MKYLFLFLTFLFSDRLLAQNKNLVHQLVRNKYLIALWDFKEPKGEKRKSLLGPYALSEMDGQIDRMDEGPLSGYSAKFGHGTYLSLKNDQTGLLNIHGRQQGITVMAWVKWTGETTGFVGGMWNEYLDGGKRQYGLFVSLPYYDGKNQVCGHISLTEKPTPPFPYSSDYSASQQEVKANEWTFIAFIYDGEYICLHFNGQFQSRKKELILNTKGFEGYPDGLIQSKNPYFFPDGMGNNGSDFTVGAVLLKRGMGNFFKGQIGGLAVFNRSLSPMELKKLAKLN